MNMELGIQLTDSAILENLIDEKNREINRLRIELARRPKIMDEHEWFEHFGSCDYITECMDKMVELGYVKLSTQTSAQ